MINDIKSYETFAKIVPLNKGISGDKKYYIETISGSHLLLRISDIAELSRKKTMFEMISRVAALGIPMPQPIDFGLCDGGKSVYTLLTWCEGEDAENVLPTLSEAEQYLLGLKAGACLRKTHSISATDMPEDWVVRYNAVLDLRLPYYHKCGVSFEGDTAILDYLEKNRHLLHNRPQCFQHGDFHLGNIILGKGNELSIIDWDYADFDNFGDPWADFRTIGGNVSVSPYFATGQINGYFGGEPPEEFWRVLAFYLSAGAITAIAWSLQFGQEMTDEILTLNKNVLKWFDNMRNPVPTWYLKNGYY